MATFKLTKGDDLCPDAGMDITGTDAIFGLKPGNSRAISDDVVRGAQGHDTNSDGAAITRSVATP